MRNGVTVRSKDGQTREMSLQLDEMDLFYLLMDFWVMDETD